jgi:two-component system, chemotaxis family, protein-glutamate methylesterase/glutaminase
MPTGRILVVDDSPFVRRAVTRMLEPLEGVEIAGYAGTGAEAVHEVERLAPDVVIMDVNMPEMDGLEALESIMRRRPTAVLLMSTLTRPGAEVTLRGLELGAVDFIDKGSAGTAMDIFDLGPVLREKVTAMLKARTPPAPVSSPGAGAGAAEPRAAAPPPGPHGIRLVVIGASTGGPRALTRIIPALPADLGAAVVVAQHMPEGFTGTLAERLDRRSPLPVHEAHDGDLLSPGTVHVAPGRREMRVVRRGDRLVAEIRRPGSRMLNQPSVDRLLHSAAEAVGERALGVVLTGMGEDGADGSRALREAGGTVIVESEETAVIYGMPRATLPFAHHVLPLDRIASAITRLCEAPATPGRLG